MQNEPVWCHMYVGTGVTLWSHTPEEFVAELRRRGETLCVAKGSCKECYCTPDRSIERAEVAKLEEWGVPLHIFPECLCAAVALMVGGFTDNFIQCYGYYYKHFHDNPYLQAAYAAGLVTFVDTTGFPGIHDTPFAFMGFS